MYVVSTSVIVGCCATLVVYNIDDYDGAHNQQLHCVCMCFCTFEIQILSGSEKLHKFGSNSFQRDTLTLPEGFCTRYTFAIVTKISVFFFLNFCSRASFKTFHFILMLYFA